MKSSNQIKLLVTNEVLFALNKEALKYPDRETACGIVGLVLEDGTIAITDIVPAPVMGVVRNVATARLGGEDLRAAVRWLRLNFGVTNRNENIKFALIGKGHSHQRLGFNQFSSTDMTSILESVRDHGSEFAVWPLMLISEFKNNVHTTRQMEGTVSVESDTMVNVRFYYLDAEMVKSGQTTPLLVRPRVVNAKSLPMLPPLAWQFTDEDNFRRQLRQLQEYEAKVAVLHHNVNGDALFEVQFLIQHPKWRGSLVITTNWDYPKTPPLIQVVSDIDPTRPGNEIHEITKDADGGPLWTPETDFIDIVLQLVKLKEL